MGEAIISRTLENEILVVQETGTSTTDVMSQKAVTDELNNKVDKVEGKGLSTNDFTAEDKEKLDNAVPTTCTVNAKPLTSDIVLTPEDIGALPTSFSNHTHSADNITSGVIPISRGGTGSDTPEYARNSLDVYSKSEVDFKLSASNLGNIIYPVGSIYLSVNSTNPQYLFGGIWEQIKDRFLLGAGDSYYAGSTGGEAMHTLTQNEMPRYSHRINESSTEQRWSGEDGYWANFRVVQVTLLVEIFIHKVREVVRHIITCLHI